MYPKTVAERARSLVSSSNEVSVDKRKSKEMEMATGSLMDHSTKEAGECRLTEPVEGRILGSRST